VDDIHSCRRRRLRDGPHGALGEADTPPVDAVRLADEGHGAVAELSEVLHAQPAGRSEVEVDAVQAGRVGWHPDEHGSDPGLADRRDALVGHPDVGEDDRVRAEGGCHSLYARRPLVVALQQDLVPVVARPGHDAHGNFHHDRHVAVAAKRQDKRNDVGSAARQRAGAGVRVVVQGLDGSLDPLPRLLRHLLLPAEHVGDCARGHAGMTRHVRKRRHATLTTLRMHCSKRFDRDRTRVPSSRLQRSQAYHCRTRDLGPPIR